MVRISILLLATSYIALISGKVVIVDIIIYHSHHFVTWIIPSFALEVNWQQ